MEPLTVEFHPAAIAEARKARRWYAKRSLRAAEAFMVELDAAIQKIAESPDRWAAYLHGTQRNLLKRYPYVVVYRSNEHKLEIVAVAHGKRRPAYWRQRLRPRPWPI